MTPDDPIWDDLFHGLSWQAFSECVAETGGIPNSEATRRRAYRLYEEELARKSGEVPGELLREARAGKADG